MPARQAVAALLIFCTVSAAEAVAQRPVNLQLNTELYGRGVGSIQQSNLPFYQAALPSDVRHDVFLSGAMRSDIRGQYGLTGPLAPSGVTSYVPSVARPYGSLGSPSGGAYLGGYERPWQPTGGSSVAPSLDALRQRAYQGGTTTPGLNSGSMRYESGFPSYGTPRSVSPLESMSVGSMRYGR